MLQFQITKQISQKGVSEVLVKQQLKRFETGFDYSNLNSVAIVGDGILKVSDKEKNRYIDKYLKEKNTKRILKFVPASGAATRMFKDLFEYINEGKGSEKIEQMHTDLKLFAFYKELFIKLNGNTADMPKVLETLLNDTGLNYGNLPKGLLKFHDYIDYQRTAFEEHLVEGAKYCKDSEGNIYLHFTISPEHKDLFIELLNSVCSLYEKFFDCTFHVTFSEQKASTDIIAVNPDNTPFIQENGEVLFRPGGHGALLENLNDLNADIVFVKNIDNVVPDRLKQETVDFKMILAGLLLELQEAIGEYLQRIENEDVTNELLDELELFYRERLGFKPGASFTSYTKSEKLIFFKDLLNRPVRVCGMVKNEGEPGGGPFWVRASDGSASLQIVEASQIDQNNEKQLNILKNATHFNPVDLVCGLKRPNGTKFDLIQYRDDDTGFISEKTKDGRPLKAQELPGLWNGAMANWNTMFVEVPLTTFNPVKTVFDLLRKEHQS